MSSSCGEIKKGWEAPAPTGCLSIQPHAHAPYASHCGGTYFYPMELHSLSAIRLRRGIAAQSIGAHVSGLLSLPMYIHTHPMRLRSLSTIGAHVSGLSLLQVYMIHNSMRPRSPSAIGAPFSFSHWSTCKWPLFAARLHAIRSNGAPYAFGAGSRSDPISLNHMSISRFPLPAANAHVHSSHGAPFSFNHRSTCMWPLSAAYTHVSSSHGAPFSLNHRSTSMLPLPAAQANVDGFFGISRHTYISSEIEAVTSATSTLQSLSSSKNSLQLRDSMEL